LAKAMARGIRRVANAAWNPRSFWREILEYGFFMKERRPKEWFRFRHTVAQQCAILRTPPGALPQRALSEMFPDIGTVRGLTQPTASAVFNVSTEELLILCHLTRLFAPQRIFEFGTFDGRTTLHLALNCPDDGAVYTMDVVDGAFDFGPDAKYMEEINVGQYFKETAVNSKITRITADSTAFDFSPYAKSMDLIFVDAGHSYDVVMHDSRRAFEMVRPGGVIIWHDYLMIDDVTRALRDIAKDKPLYQIAGTTLSLWSERIPASPAIP
jgi:predicted O-methyltransferase YrrM